MVQAVINIGEHEDRILNIVKGKHGLKNKSEAVNFIISQYEEDHLERQFKPEYIKKLLKRQKEPLVKIKDFKKHFGIEKDV